MGSRVEAGQTSTEMRVYSPTSNWKTCGVALTVILGIGGLAVGGVGVAGYFQVGSLSSLSQLNALILMGAGGGGGVLLSIAGIVCAVKMSQVEKLKKADEVTSRQVQLIYGPEVWQELWGVEIINNIPKAPHVDWDEMDPHFHEPYRENYILLYIPLDVKVRGEPKPMNFKTLTEICGESLKFEGEFQHNIPDYVATGWVLMSKKFIRRAQGASVVLQKTHLDKNFRMPLLLEAVALNMIVHASTGKYLYTSYYARCEEEEFEEIGGGWIEEKYYYYNVGKFSPRGLSINNTEKARPDIGLAPVKAWES